MPTRPPEFFLDRGLGRRVAEELAVLGWLVHRIADHFPNDTQQVSDDEWLEHGFHRSQEAIWRRIPEGGPAIYAVGADDVYRTWPRRQRRG